MPAWILNLVLIPLLALFGWIGLLYLFRGTPMSRIRVLDEPGDNGEPTGVSETLFLEVIESQTRVELEPDNAVELLFNGDGVYPRLFDDLRAAQKLITFHVFWFRPGRLAEELREILEQRARAGVRVLFMHDYFGSRPIDERYYRSLKAAGVEVATFRPLRRDTLHKVQQRSHTRCVVIDGVIGYTGGFAIADEWLGDGRHEGQWRDTSVRIVGRSVLHLQSAFVADWTEACGELLLGSTIFPKRDSIPQEGSTYGGLLHTTPSPGSTAAERFLALSIVGARETLYITNAYFIPDDDFRRLLIETVARGVDVRVLTPGRNTDKPSTWYAARANYEELLAGGVRIWEYRPTMVHAKTMVADRVWCTVGTMNFDNRSLALNDEVVYMMHDRAVAARLHRAFLDDLEHADEVRLDSFRRRGRVSRLKERWWVTWSRLL
ncbi:MAG TPA: phospholipase D-like domain-containing protein [Longimicrobiales bacterium]|nr:phospholipase D-like domain-containing protein [Longimicrobiales bacterium]